MNVSKALTWDELADEYDKDTGARARTMKMDTVFEWAERQTKRFFVDPVEGTIHNIV